MMSSIYLQLSKTSRFVNDAAGLEKVLRLLQNLAQIVVVYSITAEDAEPWLQARRQFALGRRYLRFVRFFDCFSIAFVKFQEASGFTALLDSARWSTLGMYLLLESCTIFDAMGVWSTTWGPPLLVEALKFWFYSLVLSLAFGALQLYELSYLVAVPPPSEKAKRANGKAKKGSKDVVGFDEDRKTLVRRNIMKRIIIDACDLLTPGAVTGWIDAGPAVVAMAAVVSTVLASGDIWDRL